MQSSPLFVVLLLLLIGSGAYSSSVTHTEKEMLNQLKKDRGTARVKTLNALSEHYYNFYLDSKNGLLYSRQALELSEQIRYVDGKIVSLINIGMSYFHYSQYQLAKKYLEQSLRIAQRYNNQAGVVKSLNGLITTYREEVNYKKVFETAPRAFSAAKNPYKRALYASVVFELGRTFLQRNDYPRAVAYFLQVVKDTDDPAVKMLALTNLGIIYSNLNEYKKALSYYLESYSIHKKYACGPSIMHLVNLGWVYHLIGDYKKAIIYGQQAYELVKNGENKFAEGVCVGNVAFSYIKIKEYKAAEKYFNKAMRIWQEMNSGDGICDISNGLSELNLVQGRYHEAIRYARQAVKMVEKTQVKSRLLDAYQFMSEAYAKMGNYSNAYHYQLKRISIKDSLFSKENNHKITILHKNHELQKKQAEINLLAKKKALQQAEIERQRLLRYALIAGLVAALLFAGLLLRAYKGKQRTNSILEERNNEISQISELLRCTQEKLKSALSSGLVGTWINDLKKNIYYLDESLSNMLGIPYTIEGIESATFFSMMHQEDMGKEEEEREKAIQLKREYETEYRILHPEGRILWAYSRGRVEYDALGEAAQFSGVLIDITEKKEANHHKDEFLTIASHELRTPLTSIKGYLQLAERNLEVTHIAYPLISKTSAQVKRLERLTSDLMDVSRISSGELYYNFTEFNFAATLKDLVESIQFTIKSHQIILEQKLSVNYTGDKYRIEQVINNLLSNAVKYSPGADMIIVKAVQSGDNIVVSVQDFGIGIPKEHIGRLNERFYRVRTEARKYEGLGLGLYIVSEILRQHSGYMWVESEPGKGSTFYFSLPVNAPTPAYEIESECNA